LAGLAAAHALLAKGIPVTVLEREPRPGGLARSVSIGGESIDAFYHFICRPDVELVDLIARMGLQARLHWRPALTSCLQNGRLYRFTTPLDLLRFTPVPFGQRLRFGWTVLRCQYRKDWQDLDAVTARDWLTRQVGEQAYNAIWDPLLRIKFGAHHGEVSAAWIWHRIHRVARSRRYVWERQNFGYLEGGTDTLTTRLAAAIASAGGRVLVNAGVEGLAVESGRVTGVRASGGAGLVPSRYVYSTVPLPLLADWIAAGVPDARRAEWQAIKAIPYIGVVCVLLRLAHPVGDSFWTNISIPDVHVNGLVGYTHLNRHFDSGRSHLVYIPFYGPCTDSRFTDEDAVMHDCLTALRAVQPAFDRSWVLDTVITRATHAQAICGLGFGARKPPQRGPLDGLYLSDSSQLYPEDRSLSGAVRLGLEVAAKIEEDWRAGRAHA
jgi:protoporphyrinogen oxidase